jgi:hypothetical protein
VSAVVSVSPSGPDDLVAWLRALSIGTVLLDESGHAWQKNDFRPILSDDPEPYIAFGCAIGDSQHPTLDDRAMLAMTVWRPFRVLYTPAGTS